MTQVNIDRNRVFKRNAKAWTGRTNIARGTGHAQPGQQSGEAGQAAVMYGSRSGG